MAQRISIGFQASPPLALRVSDDELDAPAGRARPARAGTTSSGEDGTVRAEPRSRSSGVRASATSTASASA